MSLLADLNMVIGPVTTTEVFSDIGIWVRHGDSDALYGLANRWDITESPHDDWRGKSYVFLQKSTRITIHHIPANWTF